MTERIATDCRGVAPVIATILLVALVVVLAAVISTFVLAVTEDVDEPGPVVSEFTEEFAAGGDSDEQVVRLTHVAGDTVDVSELEILVDATVDCDTSARLVDLPSGGPSRTILAESVEGDEDLVDNSPGQAGDLIGTAAAHNVFTAGTTLEFRVPVEGCDFREPDVDTLRVTLVHVPSNSLLIDTVLTVE